MASVVTCHWQNAAGLSLCESDSCLPPRVFGFHDIDPWFAWPTENSMKIGSNYPHFTLWETYKKLLKMIIYSGFSHWKWWFSIVMLVYQRVSRKSTYSIIWFKYPRVGLNSWSNIWRTYRGHSSWLVTSPLETSCRKYLPALLLLKSPYLSSCWLRGHQYKQT